MKNNFLMLLNRFFSERSFALRTKVLVYSLALIITLAIALLIRQGPFNDSETRLILYLFHVLIFASTLFAVSPRHYHRHHQYDNGNQPPVKTGW